MLPPTALFNEGWMLRLVLDWFADQPAHDHPLAFMDGARWYSEALLGSQFRARWRGDPHAEAWTHADGVIGHFHVRARRGDLALDLEAGQLVVTEAKLYSGLSVGTTRAKTFNQAARNVACMAELIGDRNPAAFGRLGFCVLAPSDQIARGVFGELCERDHIAATVRERVASYGGEKDQWHQDRFLPVLAAIRISVLSWESVLEHIASIDADAGPVFDDFYRRCVAANQPASPVA